MSRDPRVELQWERAIRPSLPPLPLPDHVTLPLALMFEDVVLTATTFSFYDCSAVQALEVAAP